MSGMPSDHRSYACAALPAYGRAPDAPLRLLSLSENATYLVDDGDPLVLRVHRPGYHSLAAIRSELAWMTALRQDTDVVTPALIPAADGREVVAAVVDERTLYVDAMTFVDGCTAEERPDAVGYDELGRLTAQMHDHTARWAAPDSFTRFRWDLDATLGPAARWGDWRSAAGLGADGTVTVEKAAARVAQTLTEFGQTPDRFGLIHADLRMANLMVGASGLTVIDFDDSGWSWYLADLSAVVSFIEDTPDAGRMIADWLRGYREVRSVPSAHLAMIPTLVMWRRLMLTAWVSSHADSDAAVTFGRGFAEGTVALAQRYLTDRDWMRYE
ncbi:phosphotransferase enzyme family protein [Mycobacterium sp. SMC-4]|uniref:phosphotransferase enzyme family protein n=1 Tax=Mycobacterium sp. SMC-4 TaxID=2857059 RepID=UPI0021B24622|nr:phosphotransferase [Mycobacterium sp. SMC-4]UXA17803.1 phosphotransferase [Mycobacterium sp. SMC-4]